MPLQAPGVENWGLYPLFANPERLFVENPPAKAVTEGHFRLFSTSYPPAFPRPASEPASIVENPADNCPRSVDKMGTSFFAHAASHTVLADGG